MARKSPLSEKKWEALRKEFEAGKSGRSLADKYGVSESAIRKRFSARTKAVKAVANQLFVAESALAALPMQAQISARTLADELKAISMNLAGAGRLGSMTSHRLAKIANDQVDKIDEIDPMLSQDVLQGIAALTKMANESSVIPMNLLNANKELLKDFNNPPPAQITKIERVIVRPANKNG